MSQSDTLKNQLLIAMPSLEDPNFSRTVTYICEHSDQGAMGIVLNQPLDLTVGEIFEHLQIPSRNDFSEEPVMAGGPVQIDHGFVLHRNCEATWEASLKVTPEITLTTSRDILRAIANDDVPNDHLIALGYAGWAAGQLEQELSQMTDEEASEFLAEFSITASAMDRVLRRSYDLLGLISFFTVGKDEVRAWTIKRGTPAVEAAGAIHSDIQKGFIRAEVLAYDDLMEAGTHAAAKKNGVQGMFFLSIVAGKFDLTAKRIHI